MRTNRPYEAAVLLALLALGASVGRAQTADTTAARADGKAFGGAIGQSAQNAASQLPDASALPATATAPDGAALFSNPDRMTAAAAATASSNEGYRTVRSSIAGRPRIAAVDIDATIARSKAVSADPMSFVSSMSGGQGKCRPLPPASAASAGTYEATCNTGVALEQSTESCSISLEVTLQRTTEFAYWCSETDARFNRVDDCALFAGASCQRTGQHPGRCLQGDRNNCVEPGEPVAELSCDAQVAGGTVLGTRTVSTPIEHRDESSCAGLASDSNCAPSPDVCTSSDPVTRDVDGVAVTKPCWAWTRTYQCNRTRDAQDCSALDANKACSFVRETCLTGDTPCPTKERVYRCPVPPTAAATAQYICDGDIYCVGGECETIDRTPNTEFKDAAVALNAASQASKEFDPASLQLFKGTRNSCAQAVFGLLDCCRGRAFPLLPGGSLLLSLGCSREEATLDVRDGRGLCTYIGSYCASDFLGICLTKRKVYCCYESKLSRILQEQGRAQLGLRWASPKTETCRGFTVDEFARLDLSRMDFSEVYAEFEAAAKLPDELATASALQTKISDYYAQHRSHP